MLKNTFVCSRVLRLHLSVDSHLLLVMLTDLLGVSQIEEVQEALVAHLFVR